MIHYFVFGSDIAAVEDSAIAARFEAAGWQPVTCAAFVEAWRARDLAWTPLPREKAVADVASAGVPGSVRLVPVKH
jgi:hypothetical protein